MRLWLQVYGQESVRFFLRQDSLSSMTSTASRKAHCSRGPGRDKVASKLFARAPHPTLSSNESTPGTSVPSLRLSAELRSCLKNRGQRDAALRWWS